MDDIRKVAAEGWHLKGRVALSPMGKGFILFQFELEGDMANIWRRNLIKVRSHFIRFQRWKLDFDVNEVHKPTKLVWIRFPDLPLEYWHEKILLSMAKGAGRPVALDKRTRSAAMGNFPRVQVEVVIGARRVEELHVERKQPGSDEIFWFKQIILYEDDMYKCSFYKKVGHAFAECRERKILSDRTREKEDLVAAAMAESGGAERTEAAHGGEFPENLVSNLGKSPSQIRGDSSLSHSHSRENIPLYMEGVQTHGEFEIVIPFEKSQNLESSKENIEVNNGSNDPDLALDSGSIAGADDGSDLGPGLDPKEVQNEDVQKVHRVTQSEVVMQQEYSYGAMAVHHLDVEAVDNQALEQEGSMEERRKQKGKNMTSHEQTFRKSDRLALQKK
ncbi:uncharacterized protein LOC122071062 [Macadamia integrifolia]|uniref:uncharacterized protein LOC122071062 n=1 Tax=Macadamia integrifolia TaxID=60698 RepID=UPI001C4F505C|nr:uncharacterized protein LOC122071062 [Macadamia integrifolia]